MKNSDGSGGGGQKCISDYNHGADYGYVTDNDYCSMIMVMQLLMSDYMVIIAAAADDGVGDNDYSWMVMMLLLVQLW